MAALHGPAAWSGEANSAGELEEVVVTGLKREQKLADVPAAIQVYDDTYLANAGVSRPSDLLQTTPNVNFYQSRNAGDFLINIRGQTSIRGAEPSIRVIIDGVPIAEYSQFSTDLVDVQQVEVLRGPQGALYGRNASAGAIVVTTKAPQDEWEGEARAGLGNWNTSKASLSFGGAIVPGKLRLRGTISSSDTDGAYTNIITNEKSMRYAQKMARVRADWIASEALLVDARFEYQKGDGGSHAYAPQIGVVPGLSPNGTVFGGVPITAVDTNFAEIPFVSDVPGRYQREIVSGSLKIDYDLQFATFTSVTSYATVEQVSGGKNLPYGNRADRTTDLGGWARVFGDQSQNFYDRTKQFDQELRLTSKSDGPLQWQVGFEYLQADLVRYTNTALNGGIPAGLATLVGFNGYVGNQNVLVGGGTTVPDPRVLYGTLSPYASRTYQIFENEGTNYAPFANVQWQVTDRFSVGFAGRYDIEERSTATTGPATTNPFTNAPYNSCVSILRWTPEQCAEGLSDTFEHFQPKLTANFRVSDGLSVYASYGVGFKTGGFNAIGTRETLVRSKIPVYVAQGQTAAQARASAEGITFTQDTYDKETTDAFELGFKGSFLDRRLTVNGAVFHTKIENSQQYRFDVGASLGVIDNIDEATIMGAEFDLNAQLTDALAFFLNAGYIDTEITKFAASTAIEGNRTPYTPEYNVSTGFQLLQPIGNGLDLVARLELNRLGETWYNLENTPGTNRDPLNLVNARLGISGEGYEVAVWGRNLGDEQYASEAVVVFPYLNVLSLAPTRSYGIEGRVKF
jgi:iron complex outermembrane receptor protein